MRKIIVLILCLFVFLSACSTPEKEEEVVVNDPVKEIIEEEVIEEEVIEAEVTEEVTYEHLELEDLNGETDKIVGNIAQVINSGNTTYLMSNDKELLSIFGVTVSAEKVDLSSEEGTLRPDLSTLGMLAFEREDGSVAVYSKSVNDEVPYVYEPREDYVGFIGRDLGIYKQNDQYSGIHLYKDTDGFKIRGEAPIQIKDDEGTILYDGGYKAHLMNYSQNAGILSLLTVDNQLYTLTDVNWKIIDEIILTQVNSVDVIENVERLYDMDSVTNGASAIYSLIDDESNLYVEHRLDFASSETLAIALPTGVKTSDIENLYAAGEVLIELTNGDIYVTDELEEVEWVKLDDVSELNNQGQIKGFHKGTLGLYLLLNDHNLYTLEY